MIYFSFDEDLYYYGRLTTYLSYWVSYVGEERQSLKRLLTCRWTRQDMGLNVWEPILL